jgi:hypothetical protein
MEEAREGKGRECERELGRGIGRTSFIIIKTIAKDVSGWPCSRWGLRHFEYGGFPARSTWGTVL